MTAHELVARTRDLPQIPEAALKLIELLDEAENNNREIVGLIKSDPALTAKLLRICNSSAFALQETVSSVDQAVLLLGHSRVLSLVLPLAFGNTMTSALPGYAIEVNWLWRHAFATATAAEAATSRGLIQGVEPSVAFTAGLLHDIGKLIMAQALPVEAHSSIHKHMASEGLGSIEAEREVLGTDHAAVGSCLLHVWRLPDGIIEAVANHHQPILEPSPRLSAIVHVANRIAHLSEARPDLAGYTFRSNERVVRVLELNVQEQGELVQAVWNSSSRASELLTLV
jgi:putative nucleotidyltransferase with HDIG domain